jgi:dipeptidyl aminopeptidase/acylaminoacyl peptidase
MTDSFASAEAYIALPRVESVAVAPGGERAVLTVATLSADRTRYVHSLWSVAGDGSGEPRRLTPAMKSLGGATFTAAGDVLFVSTRRDGDGDDDDDSQATQLWLLPAAGGEARPVTHLAGGAQEVAALAHDGTRIVISAELLRSAGTVDEDSKLRAERKKRKVSAILHDAYPVRFWDHDLGPGEPHLLTLDLAELSDVLPEPVDPAEADDADDDSPKPYPAHLPAPRDLTPHPRRTAEFGGCALTPDGATLIACIQHPRRRGGRGTLQSFDTAGGEARTLFGEEGVQFESPAISHDGTRLAFIRSADATPAGPTAIELWVAGVDGSGAERIAGDWDRYPVELHFAADDSALIVTADENGRTPVFRIPLDGGEVTRLVDDEFAYGSLSVDPDTGAIAALRASLALAPHPVRIAPDGTVTPLATPAPPPEVPGRVEELVTTTPDGATVQSWLVLPEGASAGSPAPLLLWIHGGPVSSWAGWSWRWSAMLAAARGYAVLAPNPGLSTGFGLDFVARGWNAWGQEPFNDLMAVTDAAVARDDIDGARTGAMGGSFGGYMSNWVAGHTDRFAAIVTHASLWALDAFQGTTDRSDYWEDIFTPEGALANSPHLHVANIRTPMLVIHGDRDYRVPVGEGIRLWSDLAAHHADDDGMLPHRYLYFPDENHWILSPQNSIVWWETVFAFLAEHVLGQEFARPANLG